MTKVTTTQHSNTDAKLAVTTSFKAVILCLAAAASLACWSGGDHSV